MKLNYKRTILVGMAFLSICAFWQLYDNVVPLILKNTFHMPDDIAGIIMAMDNVLALFMLPLFGKLSDSTNTKLGKRTPYIIGGTALAVVIMNLLPWADKTAQLTPFVILLGLLLIAMGTYRSPAVALMPDVTPKPLRSKANAIINLMGALGGVFTLGVTGFLVSKGADGREDYTLLFLAVSLLMVLAVVLLVFTAREKKLAKEVTDAEALDDAQAVEMTQTVEPQVANMESASDMPQKGFKSLAPGLRTSLVLILCSVFFWFMGYNAVTTAFTKYVSVQWGYGIKGASQYLMIATVGAVVSYIPVGIFASRYGRKRIIQVGVALLAVCFLIAGFFPGLPMPDANTPVEQREVELNTSIAQHGLNEADIQTKYDELAAEQTESIDDELSLTLREQAAGQTLFGNYRFIMLLMFALIGMAWAMINVNSYPMVVEISKSADIGKFTGYYYTFSMAAQIVTPIVSGWLLEHVGYGTLMPYAAIMVAISFITITLTKHGDSKPTPPKSKLEAFDAGDD